MPTRPTAGRTLARTTGSPAAALVLHWEHSRCSWPLVMRHLGQCQERPARLPALLDAGCCGRGCAATAAGGWVGTCRCHSECSNMSTGNNTSQTMKTVSTYGVQALELGLSKDRALQCACKGSMLWLTLRRVAASRAFAAKRAAVLASDKEKESPSLHSSVSGG